MGAVFRRNYAGAVILIAMVVGGGTRQGLWTDHLIELLILPALFLGLRDFDRNRLSSGARLLLGLVLALVLMQFLPWPRSITIGNTAYHGWGFASPLPQASLEAALFTVALAGFALYLSRLGDAAQERCLNYVVIGFFVNFIAGLIQLASGRKVASDGIMPFEISAGMFANENHFSTLIYMMIPLIAWYHLGRSSRTLIYVASVFLIVSYLFAFGSRAGMLISMTLALLCLFWFLAPRAAFALKAGVLLCSLAVLSAGLWAFSLASTLQEDLRSVFFVNTMKAIGDHWLFGSGLGTFTAIYPAYEPKESTIDVYANHAHNDFLEIFLETGVFGGLLIALYFGLILRHAGRSPLTQAAFISIVAISLHSLVDYPLRTFAVAVPFVLLSVLVLSVVPDRTRAPLLRRRVQADFVRHREDEPVFADPEGINPAKITG